MKEPAPDSTTHVAKIAGLGTFHTPTLEAVEHRRLQLWVMTLSLLVSVALAFVVLTVLPGIPAFHLLTPRQLQLGLLGLVILFSAYAIEKELQLRRLTRLLVQERVLTAALTNRAQELSSLLGAAKAMNLVNDLESVLGTILDSCLGLLDGQDGSILLACSGDELRTVATRGTSQARGARVRFGEGVAGRVAASGEPLLVTGQIPPGERPRPYAEDMPVPSSSMSVPLVHHGELLGVLNVNAGPGRLYNEYDLRAMSLFGEHAAGAIANARLFEEQRLLASQNLYQAIHDSLTNLPNRGLLVDRIDHALSRRRRTDHLVAVAFVDLDDFKQINDSYGHDAGDEILVAFAERLRTVVRAGDSLARFGGDEFAALFEDTTSTADARLAADRIAATLLDPFVVGGREVFLHASIGLAIESPHGGRSANDLLRNADAANRAAKAAGKSRIVVFDPGLHGLGLDQHDLEAHLRRAVERHALAVHFQPILTLRERQVRGFEALVRWPHPERGILPAAAFLPMAEQAGMLPAIDRWVMEQACDLAATLRHRTNGADGGPPVSVNLSPDALFDRGLQTQLEEVLRGSGVPAESLMLEITEHGILRDTERVAAIVARLRRTGVRLALDDFGTGFSSLSHLNAFRVDMIKIDRVFAGSVAREEGTRALVQAIIRLGQSLSIEVVAEGIEDGTQLDSLVELGCTLGQGFGLCPPLPAADVPRFLQESAVSA